MFLVSSKWRPPKRIMLNINVPEPNIPKQTIYELKYDELEKNLVKKPILCLPWIMVSFKKFKLIETITFNHHDKTVLSFSSLLV